MAFELMPERHSPIKSQPQEQMRYAAPFMQFYLRQCEDY